MQDPSGDLISCLGSNGPCLAAFSCLISPSWHMDERSDSSELVSFRSAIPMNCKVNVNISYLFGLFQLKDAHYIVLFKILINRFKCHHSSNWLIKNCSMSNLWSVTCLEQSRELHCSANIKWETHRQTEETDRRCTKNTSLDRECELPSLDMETRATGAAKCQGAHHFFCMTPFHLLNVECFVEN